MSRSPRLVIYFFQAPPLDSKTQRKKTIVVEVDDQVDGDVLASLTERSLPEGPSAFSF